MAHNFKQKYCTADGENTDQVSDRGGAAIYQQNISVCHFGSLLLTHRINHVINLFCRL
jgi:hypothetical protein